VAAQTARQYDVPGYVEVDSLLEQVDAVSVVTPTPTHFDLAARCLDAGVHVLVEKPITETVAQAEQLAQYAAAGRLQVQVGHIERFNPAYLELRNVLDDTRLLAIHVRRLSPQQGSNADVDVILDLMIHDLDLVLGLLGREPDALKAFGLSACGPAVDHAEVHLEYAGGPLVSLTASRVTEHKIRTIAATGCDAYIECDLLNKTILIHRSTIGEYLNHNQKGVKYRQESIVERIHVPTFEPLFLQLQHFVDSLISATPVAVSARDGLRALQLAEAVRQEIRYHTVCQPLARELAAA
jgi:predicted dehydrogenase